MDTNSNFIVYPRRNPADPYSASAATRTDVEDMVVEGLQDYKSFSKVLSYKEATILKNYLHDFVYCNNNPEIDISNLASEIGVTFKEARSAIARLWVSCHWRWSYRVETYLKNRNWRMFIYNYGWSNQFAMPRTDDVNKLLQEPIQVHFEGIEYDRCGEQPYSNYYEKSIQL